MGRSQIRLLFTVLRLKVVNTAINEPFFHIAHEVEAMYRVMGMSVQTSVQPLRPKAGRLNRKFKHLFNHIEPMYVGKTRGR